MVTAKDVETHAPVAPTTRTLVQPVKPMLLTTVEVVNAHQDSSWTRMETVLQSDVTFPAGHAQELAQITA